MEFLKVESSVEKTKKLESKLEESEDKIASLLSSAEEKEENLASISKEAKELFSHVEQYDRDLEKEKETAKSCVSAIESNLESAKKIRENCEGIADEQEILSEHLRDQEKEIDRLLKGASKVGLARSFQEMRMKSAAGLRLWRAMLTVSILFLIAIPAFYLNFSPITKEWNNFNTGIFHFVLVTPIIWFVWFSAKQYSNLFKIGQDYAFKESTAMAFVGYRDEMGHDEEMLNLLRKAAIENFASNPVKLIMKHDEPVSPIHEIIQTVLKKADLDKLLEILRVFDKIISRKAK